MDQDIEMRYGEDDDVELKLDVFDPATGILVDEVLTVVKPPTDQENAENTELENLQGSMKIEHFTPGNQSLTSVKTSMEKLVGTHIHKNIIDSDSPIDTIISCSDGKVGAHRVILFAASPLFQYLFKTRKLDEICVIIVPDISTQVMTIIIHLCYTGKVNFPKELEKDVFDGMHALMIAADGDLNIKTVKVKIDPKPVQNPSDSELARQENNHQEENANEKENSNNEEVECKETEESKSYQLKSACKAILRFETHITEGKDSNVNYHCTSCETMVSKKQSMQKHIRKHSNEFNSFSVTSEEYEKLRQCQSPECKKPHATVFATDYCLEKHGNTRCYTCFEIYPTEEIGNHFRLDHGIASKFGLVVKCRWCDVGVEISTNGSLVLRHARNAHINTKRIGVLTNAKAKLPNKQVSTTLSKRRAPPPPEEEQSTSATIPGPTTILSPTTAFDGTIKSKVQASSLKRKTPLTLNKGQPNANVGTLLPFLKMYQDNLKNEESKRRKLDENGIPLQIAKKTGKPYKMILRDETGKIMDIEVQDFEKFRKLQVVLNRASETEIEKLKKKETQNIVPLPPNQGFDNQIEKDSEQLPDEFFDVKSTMSSDSASQMVDNLF